MNTSGIKSNMPTHMFQVTSFRTFDEDIRTSPSMSHVTRSGSLESRIEIESRDDCILFYLSLQPADRLTICSGLSIAFAVMNQYSADHYTKQLQSYTCGLFGNQVYGCRMEKAELLQQSGLCMDDTVTFVATFKLPVCGLIVPVFGQPSDLSRADDQTLAENADLFLQHEDADIMFQIGRNNNDLVPGHRAIVRRRCPAFRPIIGCDKTRDRIVIDDVALTVFLTVLRFVYCNEIVIDRNFVFETLAAADKFSLPDLSFAVACLMQQESRILPIVLNYDTSVTENRFADLCSHMIQQDISSFLTNDLMLLTQASVTAVVSDASLGFREEELWRGCMEWAEEECEKRSLERTAANLRSLVKPFLFHFRFPLMDLVQFTAGPADSGILTLQEVVDVYKYHATQQPSQFFTSERRTAGA